MHAESEPQPPYLPAQRSQLDIFTDLIAPYLSVKTMAEINLMQEEAKKDPNLYTSELYSYQIMEQNIMRDIVFTKSQYCTSTPYDIKVNEDDEDNISESLLIDQYKVPSFNSYNRGTDLSKAFRASIQSEYHIFGTANGESLDGSQNGDLIRGRDGNDKIRGLGGDDFINGNVGEDDINGNDGNDVLRGGLGDDLVLGGKGNDEIHGDDGNDTLKGNDGNDSIHGLDGDDFINGNIGNDFINGNTGNDTLHGSQGNDFIHGGKDNDTIYGGMGNDIMNGDLGNDTLEGRQGSDVFFYGIGSGNDTFSDEEGEMDAILCEGKYAHIGEVIEDGNKITIKFSDTDVLIIQDKTKFEYIDCARFANGNSTYFPTWVITHWIEAIKTKPDEAVVKWKTCANSIPSKCHDELDSFACDTNRRILLEEEQLSNVRAFNNENKKFKLEHII